MRPTFEIRAEALVLLLYHLKVKEEVNEENLLSLYLTFNNRKDVNVS